MLEEHLAAEVELFAQSDRSLPPAPCGVLFVGSSSIVRWETLTDDMAPLPVVNRGFGGSQIADLNRWFDQLVTPYRPSVIVFYSGENDIAAGKPVDRVVADFEAFMARKSAALGQVPVYFVSLKPSTARFEQLDMQSQVNDAIRARSARRNDLYYIDVVAPMLEDGQPKDLFVGDNLHMNPAGYAIWAQALRNALMPNAEAGVASCRQSVKARG